jgi:photosystem II stability/assembly factor-like uncharacterized protein
MNRYTGRFILITVLAFLVTAVEGQEIRAENQKPENTAWKIIGPGGGGGVFLPTISPFDEHLVLTHCDMTGAYISYNGGSDWRMFNLWSTPNDFAFDPVDPDVIYTATQGYRYSEDRGSALSMLFRSADRGQHWQIVYPDPGKAKKTDHLQSRDFLPSGIIPSAFDGSIEKVRIDPHNNKRIFLGLAPLQQLMSHPTGNDNAGAVTIVLSEDYGKTWKMLAKVRGQHVKAIFIKDGETIVFTDQTCAILTGPQAQITELSLPVKRITLAEGNGRIIYIQSPFRKEKGETQGGVFVTRDGGKSWAPANQGLLSGADSRPPSFSQGLAVCAGQPETAYISVTKWVGNGQGETTENYCIFKTTDAGSSWNPVLLSSNQGYITKNFKGSWMEQSYDPGWGGAPINLGVAPGNPDICYAGDNGRCYKTTDGGKSWEQVYSHNLADGTYTTNGLNVTTCYGVHFDPFDKEHLFICYTDIGLFHSFNGGGSWIHSITGIPGSWLNTCYQIAFDPDVKNRLWSAWANAHDLPREKMFGGRGFDGYAGGVAVSDDGGRTWLKSSNGLPGSAICTNILLDPSTPAGHRTLYVSVFGKGVYRSTDGGLNWEKKNKGFGENLFAWQIRRNAKGRLFVLFARGKKGGATVDGAIYYSDDQGENWQLLPLPAGVNGPHDLLIDPADAGNMYVSCWPRHAADEDVYGGVIRTRDGGLTWKQVFDPRIRVNSANVDPEHPGEIFINTFQNAAYYSKDYGENWKRIKGYRFKWGQRAIPDIHRPGMLYLTTYGGSVFYGPVEGTADAADIGNMPDEWW